MNPFEELNNQITEEVTTEEEPTLRGAATAISDGLSHYTTKKGVLRPRPLSWAKKVARDHFGWSRIGSKKFESILEIGYSNHWFEKTEQGRLLGSSIPDGVAEQTKLAEMGSPKSKYLDMSPFYRSAGALGNWRVLSEDDWDGQTYTIITQRQCPWIEKPIEVPSWVYGQRVYELYAQKVSEDLANGAAKTYCTSCKSQLDVSCVYPDSHGRYACNACNDLQHPDLRGGSVGIKKSHMVAPPKKKKSSSDISSDMDSDISELGRSIRDDKVADLMDVEAAIASAK